MNMTLGNKLFKKKASALPRTSYWYVILDKKSKRHQEKVSVPRRKKGLIARPNKKQKGKDLERLCEGMIEMRCVLDCKEDDWN